MRRSLLALAVLVPAVVRADRLTFAIANGQDGEPSVTLVEGEGRAGTPSNAAITRWVEASARAVSLYYHHFPVAARLVVSREGGGKISGGVTYGGRRPSIHVTVGEDTTAEAFTRDWVLPHEMIHLALPDLHEAHAWFAEGSATYVEPIARVMGGLLPEDDVWGWLTWGLPKGLPRAGDPGLEETRSWGRTYWGGALFFLLADVDIRRKTGDRKTLGDALRGILDAGGDMTTDWPLEKVLERGDRAVGTSTLESLYERLGRSRGDVDLPALFRELGVSRHGDSIVYDPKAPLADLARSIPRDRRDVR